MYPESSTSSNTTHRIAIVIPQGEDSERWIDFAGQRLAERFGSARGSDGMAASEIEGLMEIIPVIIIYTYVERPLTELDLTIAFGIGLRVYLGLERAGVALLIDDDAFVF